MLWFSLGWRSIWRHRRRTLISMSAVGLGLFLAIVYVGLSDGMIKDATDRMDRTGLGHVQIHAPGFREERDVAIQIAQPAALLDRLTFPEGTKVSVRVLASGLLTTAWGSRGALVMGVDPVAEAGVAASIRDIVEGEALEPGDRRGILVGVKMAQRLKLKVGGKLVMTAQRPDGELGSHLFRVRGIFGGVSAALSSTTVYVSIEAAREMLGIGDAAHEVVVFLADSKQAEPLVAALRVEAGDGVEILSLGEFLPLWKEMERMMEAVIYAIIMVVYILVGLGILNVLLMSVLERTREFGMMMAIGTPPARIIGQVLGEGAWIATFAVIGGLILGLAVNAYGEAYGLLDYSEEFGAAYEMSGVAFDSKMRSLFSIPRALQTAAIVWVLTVLVAVYPAWRVSRLRPADALRKV